MGLATTSRALSGAELDRATAYVVIEATNLWASYCRCLFVSSAYGARDAAGPVLPANKRMSTEEQAITEAIRLVKPGVLKKKGPPWNDYDEPAWRDIKQFSTAIQGLGSTNASTIVKALAANTTVLSDMPTFRHFYAHRAKSTADEARRVALVYTLPAVGHPTNIVRSFPSGSSESVVEAWLRDLDGIVGLTV